MATNISVYADGVEIEPNGRDIQVNLSGIEISQVLAEFSAADILEYLDDSAIEEYAKDYIGLTDDE